MPIFFSLIVPVYNSEKYLSFCLTSILKQKFYNQEIIIIDDNSKDGSSKIYNRFKEKFDFIKIIKNKKNLGVSISRNIGMRNAKGKYLIYLDSDDILLENSLQNAYSHLIQFKPEVLIIRYREIKNFIKSDFTYRKDSENRAGFKFPKKKIYVQNILSKITDVNLYSPLSWNFIIENRFIKNNKIYFDNIKIHEDHIFVTRLLFQMKKFSFLNIDFYGRRASELNTLGRRTGYIVCESCLNSLIAFNKFMKNKKFSNIESNYLKSRLRFFYKRFFLNMRKCSKKEIKKLVNKIAINFEFLTFTHFIEFEKIFISKKKSFLMNNFVQSLEKLEKKIKLNFKAEKIQKVYIFCASSYSSIYINILKKIKIKILGIFDNNKYFHGKIFENKKVLNVNSFDSKRNINIVICNQNLNDIKNIKKQLLNLDFKTNKIFNFKYINKQVKL